MLRGPWPPPPPPAPGLPGDKCCKETSFPPTGGLFVGLPLQPPSSLPPVQHLLSVVSARRQEATFPELTAHRVHSAKRTSVFRWKVTGVTGGGPGSPAGRGDMGGLERAPRPEVRKERRGRGGAAGVGVGVYSPCAAGSVQRSARTAELVAAGQGLVPSGPSPHIFTGVTLHSSQPNRRFVKQSHRREGQVGSPGGPAPASGSPVWDTEGFSKETRKEAGDLQGGARWLTS